MNRTFTSVIYLLLYMAYGCSGPKQEHTSGGKTLYTLLSSEQTKVDFINQVDDTKEFNIFNYRNYYNGGGVAIGDIDNDGLNDIYFTSNTGPNKLYHNKGNFVFEDITEAAGVAGKGAWTTGVAMADINADGLLDIYVCNSGDVPAGNRVNELFINQGQLRFADEAESRGLASQAFSTHASFFDYDNDGDLDCFLLNNSFRTPDRLELYQSPRDIPGDEGGDRLYRNDNGIFTDVTQKAGLHSGDIGFGLGVSVSDLNNDLLPDIYVSNDFWERDYLYINQGDGTFKDQIEARVALTSLNSMGADIGDLNNDGSPDIITTDMLPGDNYRLKTMTQFQPYRMGSMQVDSVYHHQLMHNCLQVNDGDGNFLEMASMAGLAASDWSWGALILDLDLDGWNDVFISNGIQKDITDFDFVDRITNKEIVNQIVSENKGFDIRDFLPFMPSSRIPNCAFINQKNLTFNDMAGSLGLADPSFSNGAAYGDLDNDGDPDLVINNANMESFIYKNNAAEQKKSNFLKLTFHGPVNNRFGIGVKVILETNGGNRQVQQMYLQRGFQSSVAPELVFGLGTESTATSVEIIWPDGSMEVKGNVQANQTLTMHHAEAKLKYNKSENAENPIFTKSATAYAPFAYTHMENRFNDFMGDPLSYKMLSAEGPKIIRGDVNNDKHDDLIVLSAAGQENVLYIQQSDGSFASKVQKDFVADKELEATCGALLDIDSDGDVDLLIGHGGNEFNKGQKNFYMRCYRNDGKGNFTLDIPATPQVSGNIACIATSDIDRDGDLDVFIGARTVPGHYGLVPSSFLLLNNSDGSWINITTEEFGKLGMVTCAAWSDIDKDGDQDLMVAGDWMPITIFENVPGGMKRRGIVKDSHGWWSSMVAHDLDGDGDNDFVLGNWGLNSTFRASSTEPLSLYVKDFDKNGSVDKILEWYLPAEATPFPFLSKDDLVAHIPSLKQKLTTYAEYGKMAYSGLFEPEQRNGALELKTLYLESAIIWRDKNGFRLEALPREAQASPVYSIVVDQLNDDNYPDILLFGNLYGVKPEIGRMDSNRGIMLAGSGQGKFTVLSAKQSGLFVEGEVRDASIINTQDKRWLFIGRNNLPAEVYKLK